MNAAMASIAKSRCYTALLAEAHMAAFFVSHAIHKYGYNQIV